MDTARLKPFLILFVLSAALCIHFWTTSRYPDLNAKATLSATAPLSSLGFVPLFEIDPGDPLWKRIALDTVNWMETNRRGMTFAFLFGAFLLAMLPLFRTIRIKNGFAGSLFGLGVGTPLGVCVNCAVPIAKAVRDAGASLQTALAVLIASPTMNIVVVSLMFTVFPFYVGMGKILLTLLFILVVIPLSCRLWFKTEAAAELPAASKKLTECFFTQDAPKFTSWGGAVHWAVQSYLKSLWFLLKTILPLMILSGFLGTVIVTLMPWDSLGHIGQDTGFLQSLLIMAGLAGLGTFVPAPMAFDVILPSVLLQAGLPLQYAAVLLLTLGTFSIYAFLIVWRFISFRLACFMFGVTMALGMTAGLAAAAFDAAVLGKAERNVTAQAAPQDNYHDPYLIRTDTALSFAEILEKHAAAPVAFTEFDSAPVEGIEISWAAFTQGDRDRDADKLFTRINGEAAGIEMPYRLSYIIGQIGNLAMNTQSVAAGDVHNNGRPDLLIAGDPETLPNLLLYINTGNGRFVRQELPLTEDIRDVISVALADLDGDGWLDIVFSTYYGENYVIYNDKGDFRAENMRQLGETLEGITSAFAFADTARRGVLDIFLGNWSVGPQFLDAPHSGNVILRARDDDPRSYDVIALEGGATGETLTALFADLNGNGHLDLYVGNDYVVGSRSDEIYLGDGAGGFTPAGAEFNKKFPGAHSTMSIDRADITGDLRFEYYIGQIAYMTQTASVADAAEMRREHNLLCSLERLHDHASAPPPGGNPDAALEKCVRETEFRNALIRVTNFVTDACENLIDENERIMCEIHLVNFRKHCVPPEYARLSAQDAETATASERYMRYCRMFQEATKRKNFSARAARDHALEKSGTLLKAANNDNSNILLRRGADGVYKDTALEKNIGYGGWTWNARFADLTNNGLQDLYIANGYAASFSLDNNIFYRNTGGGVFAEETNASGLSDYSYTAAFAALDIDGNGALDIVTVPTDAPLRIFRNNKALRNNALQIELRDAATRNSHGIGAEIIITARDEDGKEHRQIREIKGGGGYKSFDQPVAHFGLGKIKKIEAIEISWPDGTQSRIEGEFPAGRRWRITRPAAE